MTKRAGVTRKVSLSIDKDDLALLKERAKRFHHGNVSAVFSGLIATLRRQESWSKAVDWYGKPIVFSDAELQKIDGEMLGAPPRKPRRKRVA